MAMALVPNSTTTASAFGAGVVDILEPFSTSKNKTMQTLSGVDLNGTVGGYGGYAALNSGLWRGSTGSSTEAITSITIIVNTGASFNQNSSFALYGIKAG
jgi:hypothetical protein